MKTSDSQLFYCPKYGILNENVKASMQRYSPIEIVPFNKNQFDIFSFIEFVDALSNKYICSYSSNNSSGLQYYAHYYESSPNHISFIIKVTRDCSQYSVFIRDDIHLMKFINIKDTECLYLEPNTFESNPFCLFQKISFKFNPKIQCSNSIMWKFAKHAANRSSCSPIILKQAFSQFQDMKTRKRHEKIIPNLQDIDKLFEQLPGHIYFTYQDPPHPLPPHIYDSSLITIDGKKKIITKMLWLLPYATKIIDKTHYLEIDASFKACKPFKYCIYHAIIFNVSLPLALSIAPEESASLYEMLFLGCQKHLIRTEIFEKKEVLSDMGSAIKAFCDKHKMKKNYCHRHMIEAFGARSCFGIWVTKILKCKTYSSYLETRIYIISELNEYIEKMKSMDSIDEKVQTKIQNLQIMLYDPNSKDNQMQFSSQVLKSSNYYIKRWAIWLRREKHIPRCSNHAEGSHGNINQDLPKSGVLSLKVGLSTIANYIISHITNLPNTYGNSFKVKHSKFIAKVISVLKHDPQDSYTKCFHQSCFCEESKYNEQIYGVKFQCFHTCLNEFVSDTNLKQIFDSFCKKGGEQTAKEFFIDLLESFPNIDFDSKRFQKDKAVNLITKLVKTNEKYSKTYDLYISRYIGLKFLSCFTYSLPPLIELDGLYRNFTDIHHDLDLNKYDFSKISKNNDEKDNDDTSNINHNRLKVSKNKYSFNIEHTDSAVQSLIKNKIEETINEILAIYPKLGDAAYFACVNVVVDNLQVLAAVNQENVADIFATIKITSWLNADKAAGQNLFFPKREA